MNRLLLHTKGSSVLSTPIELASEAHEPGTACELHPQNARTRAGDIVLDNRTLPWRGRAHLAQGLRPPSSGDLANTQYMHSPCVIFFFSRAS
jgi:hypothetical protein